MILREDGLEIRRDDHGVPHVRATDLRRLYRGLGYCHALDRGLQMLMMRILGRGELSERLDSSDASLAVDIFFRRMHWSGGTAEEAVRLTPQARGLCDAYTEGANARFSKRRPWELRVLGGAYEPWRIEDSLVLSRMVGYLTLAQSQAEIERLLVEMVQAGVDRARLEELFPGELEGLDETLLREVSLSERIVPADLLFSGGVRAMASNNWVVAGSKTASGFPILSNDPHLEANRLPNVWYEVVLESRGRWAIGATMPGLPGVLLGRTADLAWGATYAFMDSVDSWVERCRDGRCQRGGDWVAFRERKETIKRKGKAPHEVTFFENEHGVLDGDPRREGLYLATRWSAGVSGAASTSAALEMWEASTVEEGLACLGRIETAFNWVVADRHGSIGYQMSGLLPRRRAGVSGLVPLPGWDPENDWHGFYDPSDLPRCLNPASGLIVTANDDLNRFGKVEAITVSMGPYRAERIAQLLSGASGLTAGDMFQVQHDVRSLQAERFMAVLRPLLPDTPAARILKSWDCEYPPESIGASLFEAVYRALLREVFGAKGLGVRVVEHLLGESGIFADFYYAFDRVLLSERSAWFGGETRDALFRRVAAAALPEESRAWGDSQQVVLTHLLLGGKLPRFFGFDRGPVVLPGGRATPQQGQIYRSGGRVTSFVPSFRLVTDLGTPEVHTSLLGGPSDRRFSPWYCSEVSRWVAKGYKRLRP